MGLKKTLLGLAMVVAGFASSTLAGTLTNFSYSPANNTPGATTTYTFSYTTETTLTGGETSMFVAYFPVGFTCSANTSDILITINGSGVTPGMSTYFDANCITIVRLPDTVDAGSNIVVSMANVINPGVGIYTFGYGPLTSFMGGQPIDQPLSVNPIVIAHPAIENFSRTGSSSLPGATASYTFAYSAVNAIPAYPNNLFYFWFPTLSHEWRTGSNLNDDITITIDGNPSTGDSYVQNGARFWVNINDPIPTGGSVVVTLNNVINYTIAGSYDWTVPAQTADGSINETRYAPNMNPIVLAMPPITLEYALDRCMTNSGSINVSYAECTSLAYLYDETNGNDRSNNDGWFDSTDLSSWKSAYERSNAFVLSGDHIVELNLSENNLSGSIQSGLDNLTALRYLNLSYGNTIPSIDISNNVLLESLSLEQIGLTSLDISNNILLEVISLSNNNFSENATFDFSTNTGLKYITISDNSFVTLNISGLQDLIGFTANDNELTGLDLSTNIALEELSLRDQYISSIDLSHNTELQELDLSENEITSIDLSMLGNLQDLDLEDNQIEYLDLSYMPYLEYVYLEYNNLSGLDIRHSTGLDEIYIDHNVLTSLTISDWEDYDIGDMEVDFNGLCYVTDNNLLSFLDEYVGSDWEEYQYLCAPRNLTATPGDASLNITWNSPKSFAGANDDDNSTNVLRYTISFYSEEDHGSATLIVDEPYYENTIHDWSYLREYLVNNVQYTVTVCAVMQVMQEPERSACTSIQATPGGETRSSGGGGGGKSRDYCPNGDYSGSHLDGKCGEKTTDTTAEENDDDTTPTDSTSSTASICPDREYQLAYLFSLKYKITTMPTCIDANMDGFLIRSHAAKMMSNYAINVLGKSPDTSKNCDFTDVSNESQEMQLYMETACQLGIMGLEFDGVTPASEFNPSDYLDKAQFATILSRLLYGRAHDGNDACRYCDHVAALQDANVITVTTDLFDPLRRAFAMIMLMRTQKKDYSVVDDSSRGDMK